MYILKCCCCCYYSAICYDVWRWMVQIWMVTMVWNSPLSWSKGRFAWKADDWELVFLHLVLKNILFHDEKIVFWTRNSTTAEHINILLWPINDQLIFRNTIYSLINITYMYIHYAYKSIVTLFIKYKLNSSWSTHYI